MDASENSNLKIKIFYLLILVYKLRLFSLPVTVVN